MNYYSDRYMDRIPSVVDHEKDKKKAKWIILKSAYIKDFEANRSKDIDIINSITIREISDKNTGQGFNDFLDAAKEMDMRQDSLVILNGNRDDGIIKITDIGRNYYEENKHYDYSELDL
jgi:hypothetical protein